MVARVTIHDRQSSYIDQLQDEIKNAKEILQNKFVRQKCFESLKEYNTEIERCAHKQQIKSIPTDFSQNRPKTALHKRAKTALRDSRATDKKCSVIQPSKNRRKSDNKSDQSSIFPQKFSTSIFNTFDITLRSFTPINKERVSPHFY